jgi:hypothetical protein
MLIDVSPSPSLPQSNQLKTHVAMEGHHFQLSYEQNGANVRGSIPSFSDMAWCLIDLFQLIGIIKISVPT